MPRVPVSTNFSTAPDTLPGVQVRAPEQQAIAADQLRQTGQALGNAADSAFRIQMDIQHQANKLRLDDAMTQAQQAALKYEQEYKQLKGRDALFRGDKPLDQEYDDKLASDLQAIGASLGNEAQKQAWELESGAMRRQFRNGVASHIAGEFKTYNEQVQLGTIGVGTKTWIDKYADKKEAARARGIIISGVENLYKGSPQEFIDAKKAEALTTGHAAIIDDMLKAGQTQAARDYFASPQVQAELTQAGKARIGNVLQVSARHLDAMRAVDEVTAVDGWTIASADKMLRERFSQDPETLKVARAELTFRDSSRDESRKEVMATFIAPANQELANAERAGRPVSMSSAALLNIAKADTTGETYRQMVGRYADHNRQLQDRALARQERMRSITGQNAEQNASAIMFDMAANPDGYKGRSISGDLRDMIRGGQIRPSDALRIQKQWDDIQAGKETPELATFGTAEQYLNEMLAGAYVSSGPGDSPKAYKDMNKQEQADLKGRVRQEIDRVLTSAQQTEKRRYNDSEVRGVVANAFRNATMVTGRIWKDRQPIVVADPAGMGQRVGVTVMYNQIPTRTRAAIESALRNNGKPVTNQAVIEYYQAIGK